MTSPTPSRFERIQEVFSRVCELSVEEREAIVREALIDDPEAQQEIRSLLSAHSQAGSFLEEPAEPAGVRIGDAVPAGRFELLQHLGSGGFSEVYRARELKTGEVIALKVLRRADPRVMIPFKDEVRVLSHFIHPNFARVYELIEGHSPERDNWILKMELIEGSSIKRFNHGRTVSEIRACLAQVAEGLAALHIAGLIHGDIKPENVLVTPAGLVKILDFGLVKPIHQRVDSAAGPIAGTPAYIAPEVLRGVQPTAASDWYSFGVMMHELLAGELPGREQCHTESEQEFKIGSLAPPALSSLCERLLCQDSERRPDDAEVLRTLGVVEPEDTPVAVAAAREQFIGRDKQLNTLRLSFDLIEKGSGATVHVCGEPGIGKTALVSAFLQRMCAGNPSTLIFSGRCYDGQSVRFNALDELVDRLSRHLIQLPRAQQEAILHGDDSAIAKMFPSLRDVIAEGSYTGPGTAVTDPQELRSRAFSGLKELFGRLARLDPVVVFIDDLQWADQDSLTFLQELMSLPGAPAMLLILAYRLDAVFKDAAGENGPLAALRRDLSLPKDSTKGAFVEEIQLGSLAQKEAAELAASLMESHIPATLIEQTGRNPFQILQLCSYLRENKFENAAGLDMPSVIKARIAQVPVSARDLLEIMAVSRMPLASEVVRKSSGSSGDFSKLKDMLIAGRLIRTLGGADDRCDVYHDQLRDAVLDGLAPEAVQGRHLRIATALLDDPSGDSESIATHFLNGGWAETSAPYFEKAANEAASRLAFDRAVRLYKETLKILPGRLDLERNLADALVNAGRGSEGADVYLQIATRREPAEALKLRIRAAAELLRAGRIPEGKTLLRELLKHVGMRYPETRRAALFAWLIEKTRLRALPVRSRDREPLRISKPLSARAAERLDVCWAAAVGFSVVDPFMASIFVARYLRLATNSGDPERRLMGLAAEATQCAHVDDGKQRRTRELLAAAQSYVTYQTSDHARAFLLAMTAIADNLGGRWRECLVNASEAILIFRDKCTGVTWEISTATSFTFSSRWLLGEWAESARLLPGIIQEAAQRGDLYTNVTMHVVTGYHMLCLAENKPGKALEALDEARSRWKNSDFDVQRLYDRYSRVEIALYQGDAESASRLVEETFPSAEQSQLLRVSLLGAYGFAVKSRSLLALAASHLRNSVQRRELLRRADRTSRRLDRMKAGYGKGWAALLYACSAISSGDRDRAAVHLESAERVFEGYSLAPWLAVARIRRGRLIGGAIGQDLWKAGMAWMDAQQVKRADRLIEIFSPGDWNA